MMSTFFIEVELFFLQDSITTSLLSPVQSWLDVGSLVKCTAVGKSSSVIREYDNLVPRGRDPFVQRRGSFVAPSAGQK